MGIKWKNFSDMIQTDAAINPETVGPFLIPRAEELILLYLLAVNQNKALGLGFAIPVKEQLKLLKN